MTFIPDQLSRPFPAHVARVVRAEVTEAPVSVSELADAVQDAAPSADRCGPSASSTASET